MRFEENPAVNRRNIKRRQIMAKNTNKSYTNKSIILAENKSIILAENKSIILAERVTPLQPSKIHAKTVCPATFSLLQ